MLACTHEQWKDFGHIITEMQTLPLGQIEEDIRLNNRNLCELSRSRTLAKKSTLALSLTILSFTYSNLLSAADAAETEIQQIVVVGSHISNRIDKANPVQSLNAEDIRLSGALSLGDTLQELSSVGFSMNSTGYYGAGNGASTLNLRGLGENRNLILVNGHRWVNGANKGGLDFVDLNTIPQAIVQGVEVLPEGASAIYGSDAIAGVVNIRTFSDYEGAEVNVSYGESSRGDRESEKIEFLGGINIGRSNWMLTLSHVDQSPAYMQDRRVSRVPLNGYSTKTPEGIFTENNVRPIVGGNKITRDPNSDGSDISNWREYDATRDFSNPYYDNYLESPSRRIAGLIQNTTTLSDSLTFNFTVFYNRRDSDSALSSTSPVPLVRGNRGFYIPVNPAVNPFNVEFSGNDFRFDNYFDDVGARTKAQDVETLRYSTGLTGQLGTNWNWEVFGSWSENESLTTNTNEINLDKLALGMRACDATGITSDISDLLADCLPINLFNPLTPAMADYIRYTAPELNVVNQTNFSANLSGSLLEVPAGTVSIAGGYEYRKEESYDDRDAYALEAPRVNTYRPLSLSPRDVTDGEYDVNELYVEIDIPLLTDLPFVDSLALNLASRYSDYSTFGDTTNSRAALRYAINDQLAVRASWSEGFRAPAIQELYAGTRLSISPLIDPCADHTASYPGCASIPTSYVNAAFTPVLVGGNVNLEPETSVSKALGVSYTPDYSPQTTLSLDWHQIELDNTISSYGEQNILDSCALKGQLCGLIERENSGEIIQLLNVPINLNSTSIEMVDLDTRTSFMIMGGDLELGFTASKLLTMLEKSSLPSGLTVTNELVGTASVAESFPEWRASARAIYRKENWSVALTGRYIDETEEVVVGTTYNINSVTYFNASGSYQFNSEISATLGMNNIFDKQPPISLSNQNLNFDPQTYNAIGRYYYAQVKYTFM